MPMGMFFNDCEIHHRGNGCLIKPRQTTTENVAEIVVCAARGELRQGSSARRPNISSRGKQLWVEEMGTLTMTV